MRARKSASRLSVFTLSPEGLSIFVTAPTTVGRPSASSDLLRAKPVGPLSYTARAGCGRDAAHAAMAVGSAPNEARTISPVSWTRALAQTVRAWTSSPMLVEYCMAGTSRELW
jgi:hypothetical protein